jgi:serine beta-lactamase-like protein LACTB, mitochondrial
MTGWTSVALVSAICAAVAMGDPPQEPAIPTGGATGRQIVHELMQRAGIPGMQAAVAVAGRLIWSEAFGTADLEQRVPVSTATRFRIGSVSKAVTAAALARLVDEGRLDLDVPIRRYVPAVASASMTVRHVAGHLSGIRNYRGAEFVNRSRFDDVDAAVKIFVADPLLSEPGERFGYSSYNYTLLSAAIENAAGEPFLAYLERAVLKPLELGGTTPDTAGPIVAERARWYERSSGGIINAPWVDNSNKWAAGGLLSTAEDLVRFTLGLTAPEYLSAQTLRSLFTAQRTAAGDFVPYGIGWRLDPSSQTQAWHGGEAMGARAFLFMDVESRSVVALTSNLGGAPFDERDALALLTKFTAR